MYLLILRKKYVFYYDGENLFINNFILSIGIVSNYCMCMYVIVKENFL